MDSNNQNNDSDKVPGFDSDEIIQPAARRVSAKEIFSLSLKKEDSKFDCDIQDTQLNPKRKFSEDSNKMENEDSQNSNESVKRRRYSDSLNEVPKSNDSSSLGEKNYTLMITNSPGDWTLDEVMKFVKHECGVESVNDSREKNTGNCQVDLQFDEKEKFYHVLAKLREKEALGKLSVHCIDKTKAEPESDAESAKTLVLENKSSKFKQETREEESAGSSTPDEDFAIDPNEFYLRESYLDTLGIKSPISNWVSVTDFRCDKSELKEVLELAGRVLVCSVSMNTKHASVMYSHPLEAVQAVSMLNGQQYYGKTLQVKMMYILQHKPALPKGLADIGPGLGKHGNPLQDIGEHYKRFRKGKPSDLDACLFQTAFLKKIGIKIDEIAKFVCVENQKCPSKERSKSLEKENGPKSLGSFGPVGQKPVNTVPIRTNTPINNNVTRPNQMMVPNRMQSPIRGPIQSMIIQGPRPYQEGAVQRPGFPMVHQGVMYPNCPPVPGLDGPNKNIRGPVQGPMSPMVRQQMVGPRYPGPGPMMGSVQPGMVPCVPMVPNGPMRPNIPYATSVRMFKGPDPVLVQITNLPPTTNFVNLGQKLMELGHVVFLEFTTPGCANVRFATPADADRCLLQRIIIK